VSNGNKMRINGVLARNIAIAIMPVLVVLGAASVFRPVHLAIVLDWRVQQVRVVQSKAKMLYKQIGIRKSSVKSSWSVL
jgi:hypothetical protein